MTTGYPVAVVPEAPSRPRPPTAARSTPAPEIASAVRYAGRRNSRSIVVLAVLASAGLHAALLLGIGRSVKRPVAAPVEENIIAIRLAIPEIKDLEEPEPVPYEGDAPAVDLGELVPMQADLPQIPRPSDFVQPLNFASLIEQPDFSKLNVYAVPETIRTSGAKLAEQLGRIFSLSDLDRAPEPILQPAPMFPIAMRREAESATVSVEFIVDVNGRVLDPVVHESANSGFNDAALIGVSRWKFRPGIKAGRKVNTRMRVPIVFQILDASD